MSALSDTPQAWLYGNVCTSVPGYRKISIGGVVYTIADSGAAGLLWPAFITALDTAINASGWSAAISSKGAVVLSGSSAAIVWPDRLGALLGFGAVEPGAAYGTHTTIKSVLVPLAGIPLFGASWEEVEISRSVEYEADRLSRTVGYNWGGAKIWRWRLTMDNYGIWSLRHGWCLRGAVRILGAGTGGSGTPGNAITSSNPSGYIDGYPLGISSIRWLDDVQSMAEVEVMVSAGAA